MENYALFGGCLRSEIPFPDLPHHPGSRPDWTFSRGTGDPPPGGGVVYGERTVAPGWTLRLTRLPEGWRFTFGSSGTYDLSGDGTEITWYPGDIDVPMLVRSMVIGPVIALSLRSKGYLGLHASAVCTAEGVLGFLGPKHHGKSTLALTLVLAGAKLVTDDLLAVRPDEPPVALPGVPNLRLLPDACARLSDRIPGRIVEGAKPTVAHLPRKSVLERPARLAALYVLQPLTRHGGEPCIRELLATTEATIELARHAKLAFSPVHRDHGTDTLNRAARIAGTVPVYRLRTSPHFEALPAMARLLLLWHGDGPCGRAAGSGVPARADGKEVRLGQT